VQKGLVDFVVPMAYTQEPGALDRLIERVRRMIGVERLLVGLPVFDGRERYLGYSVSLLRRQGVIGYSLFSANELEKEPFSVPFLERVFLNTSVEEPAGDASAPDDSTSENPR
jgi:hypothetical protein